MEETFNPHEYLLTLNDRDQELRFTVHDSPDYYQLKVSVFNDDKKTDLIGETWVSLENIVVPGGGQNELWHNLNCKGRYAGEIRIELTYYDTRPREEKPVEKRRESARIGPDETGRESLSGPRFSKQPKRRPLPADPTDSSPIRPMLPGHSQSSPLSLTPPHSQRNQAYAQTTPASQLRYSQNGYSQSPSLDGQRTYRGPTQDTDSMILSPQMMEPTQYDTYNHDENDYSSGKASAPYSSFQSDEELGMRPSPRVQANDYRDSPPVATPSPSHHASFPRQSRTRFNPPALHHSNSAPPIASPQPSRGKYQQHIESPYEQSYYEPSPLNSNGHPNSSTDHDPFHQSYDHGPRSPQPSVEDDEPPPLPPAHRSSGPHIPSYEPPIANHYPAVSAPAPLNVRGSRNSVSPNPYTVQDMKTYHAQDEYALAISPSSGRGLPQPVPPMSSSARYTQSQRRQSEEYAASPLGEGVYGMPPSLIPGYQPPSLEDEPSFVNDRHLNQGRINGPVSTPTHQYAPSYENQPRAKPASRQDIAMSRPSPRDVNQAHRSSAPMIKPRPLSPDTRTPVRKSVSPQPGQRSPDDRLSTVPFSPDSYDTLNPNIVSSTSSNRPTSQYHTPEQAKEVSRQDTREAPRDEGPIIGNDGRIIDPSDHLPTDTWAPEPEWKNGKKAPEPTTRSRPSPQGAQPMPPSGRRPLREGVVRPHSISTPIYAHSPETVSPSSAARNRLQKKSLATPPQPASSPAVPTMNSMSRSSPRASTADYPLREHQNYGYGGSPMYARGSPVGAPPIPGKMSIAAGQEDYGMSALSQELQRIDIGVGAGSGRTRRSRI